MDEKRISNHAKTQRGKITNSKILIMATVSVLMSVLILSGTSQAYAVKSLGENPSIGRVGPNHFGSATHGIVCGDHLCNKKSPYMTPKVIIQNGKSVQGISHKPSVSLEQVFPINEHSGMYGAVFKVAGGDMDLARAQISIQSDLSRTIVPIDGLFANNHQIVKVVMHAKDPQSITASAASWKYDN